MAKLDESLAYVCDICGRGRTATNHWYVGFTCATDGVEHVSLHRWNARLAGCSGASHLCGMECVQKFVGRELPRLEAKNG